MAKRYDTLLRLLLVGDSGVGKTCLICQYASNEFHENHITTIGVDFKMKVINLDGKTVKMQIWDTAGQERFEAITKQFFTRAQGCILVYDICSRSSFESLAKWLLYVKRYAKDNTSAIIVGNKSDLSHKRQVPKATAQQFADENGLKFFETSAKDCNSLNQPFVEICRDVLNVQSTRPESPAESNGKVDLTKPSTTQTVVKTSETGTNTVESGNSSTSRRKSGRCC